MREDILRQQKMHATIAINDDFEKLLLDAASSLGRSSDNAKPFVRKLQKNWYDTVESLDGVDVEELFFDQM